MDVQKELGKWKSEYVKCNTPEELADHKKRFRAFLQTLSPEDKKAFAQAFQDGARQSINEAQAIVKTVEIRQTLEKVMPFASMSYIAQHYFGRTRQWLYQRINGSAVNGKPANFTADELNTLSLALSELGDNNERYFSVYREAVRFLMTEGLPRVGSLFYFIIQIIMN